MPRSGRGSRHGRDSQTELDSGTWAQGSPDAGLLAGLTILCHPDAGRIGERVPLPALGSGGRVELSRLAPEFAAPGDSSLRPLEDPHVSRQSIVFEPGAGEGAIRLRRGASRARLEVGGEPAPEVSELSAADVESGVVLTLGNRVVLLLHRFDPLTPADLPYSGLLGESTAMIRLRQGIQRVADLTVPVLLRGETGTGKELVARAVHRTGPRGGGPFVAVNMAAVPPSLAAAELFGAAKGAFTGADRRRRGYFRQAHGGTLFLDEIGDTPLDVQVLLLRCLESHEIQPVGGDRPETVDIRLVAATESDLEKAVSADRFRAPLLYRLSGYELFVPPLRARRDDLGRLLVHFLRRELETIGEAHRLAPPEPGQRPWLPAGLVARLATYDWPGNVRQLRNVARQLVIASRGAENLRVEPAVERLLRPAGPRPEPAAATAGRPVAAARRRPSDIPEDELVAALKANRWRPQATADQLGISRASIYDRIAQSSRIRTASDLGREEIESCRAHCGGDLHRMVDLLEVSPEALRRRMKQLGFD